jgi:hypothetical protein
MRMNRSPKEVLGFSEFGFSFFRLDGLIGDEGFHRGWSVKRCRATKHSVREENDKGS